jgi:hypothetical protein
MTCLKVAMANVAHGIPMNGVVWCAQWMNAESVEQDKISEFRIAAT